MVATFWLLGWVLAPAQVSGAGSAAPPVPSIQRTSSTSAPAPGRQDWAFTPQLFRGQELVYRGTFTEEAVGTRVQFLRGYRFETRYFVLETPPRGFELAALTTLHRRTGSTTVPSEPNLSSVRLERVNLDLEGKITAPEGVSLTVALNGVPTLEVGAFVQMPRTRRAQTEGWDTVEANRPPITWRILGQESVAGHLCVKLTGVQQSPEWEKPRADRPAWRRTESVWLSPKTGIAQRVERIIEQREPARREVSQRSVLRYDLESSLQYPAQLAQDRRQELLQAFAFREAAAPLVGEPARHGKQLQVLGRRIAYHLENQPPTPYREVILQVKKQVEAASRGEVVAVTHQEDPLPRAIPLATLGEMAPDFVAGPITTKESAKLSKLRGKPILLVFYHPASYTASELLGFAQHLHANQGKRLTVLGLCVTEDTAQAVKQKELLKLEFPIHSGGGMRISYGVETTPKLVVIDSTGTIRGMYNGWGRETAGEVWSELQRWLER